MGTSTPGSKCTSNLLEGLGRVMVEGLRGALKVQLWLGLSVRLNLPVLFHLRTPNLAERIFLMT